jgi:hypothetical protein
MDEPENFIFEDYAVWRTPIPDIKFVGGYHHTDRPNPRLSNGKLFISIFSPGCIYALDTITGKIDWTVKLPSLADFCVEVAGNILLAKTSRSLYSLDYESGKILWEFCPYGYEDEMIYSEPTVNRQRLFISDRQGWLHCLDVLSGKEIWKNHLSEEHDVNATACIANGLVISGSNEGFVYALSVEDGKIAWKTKIDGPCASHIFMHDRKVVASANSLHFIDPASGELQNRIEWPGYHIAFAANSPSNVLVFRRLVWKEIMTDEERKKYNSENCKAALIGSSGEIREIRCSDFAGFGRFSPFTNLLYITGQIGLDIINPATAEWLYTMRTSEPTPGYFPLPEVTNDRIYALDGNGVVYALKHPTTVVSS